MKRKAVTKMLALAMVTAMFLGACGTKEIGKDQVASGESSSAGESSSDVEEEKEKPFDADDE